MLDRDKSTQELVKELVKVGDQVTAVSLVSSDITERRQAEEALVGSEAQLLEAQEVANLGFYVHDIARGFWTSSSILDRIFGIPADYERTVEGWANLVHPDERQEMLDYFLKEVAGEKKPFDREYRIVRRGDKQVRWVHGLGRLQLNEDGQPVSMLGTIQDITERKHIEEALQRAHDELEQRVKARTAELATANANLRHSNDEFQAIYDGMPDGLLVVDVETKKFVRCNASMGRMLSYSGEELLARSVMDIYPADELPSVLEAFHALVDGRQRLGQDIPVVRKDGSVFHADVTHNEITINGRYCSVGFFRDITERKTAEDALRASEERFRVTFEEAPVGMVICVGDGVITKANRALCRMSGYCQEELVGRHVRDLTHLDDRELSGSFVKSLLDGEIPSFTLEKRYLRKSGQSFWAQATTAAIQGPNGKFAFALGVVEDIDDRKQAEEALGRERQSLWKMLQASDHERQMISYEIHDGLAQYLAAAAMQFQAYDSLRENLPVEAKKAYETALELVRQAHAESRRLINKVRPPVIDEIGLETAISHLVHEQRKRGGPKIKFDSDVQFGKLLPILENALYRIAQEALTNACKHSKSKKVMVTLAQEGRDVRLEVRDWGVGFDAASIKEGHFGVEGIRQRVRLLGGRLTIASRPDFGTLIQVVVPILEKQEVNLYE